MSGITVEVLGMADLRKMVKRAREHAIRPAVVKTARQARKMNADYAERALEALGFVPDQLPKWSVGDEYYELHSIRGRLEWKANA